MQINAVNIKINNWEKYQIKQDKKASARHHWFSFSNTFFEDHKVSCLTSDEKMVFIYVLCELSKAQRPSESVLPDEIFVNLDFMCRTICVQLDAAKSAIDKLHYLQILTASSTSLVPALAQPSTSLSLHIREHNITEENIIKPIALISPKEAQSERGVDIFNGKTKKQVLEEIYKSYPLPRGKKKGLIKLAKLVTDPGVATAVSHAIGFYKKYCDETNTSFSYFDTFMNSKVDDWLEYYDPGPEGHKQQMYRLESEIREENLRKKNQKRSY